MNIFPIRIGINDVKFTISLKFLVIAFSILILFIILLWIGGRLSNWIWSNEYFSAFLGAVVVTIITSLLIGWQAKKESDVDQKKKVFENRLKAYETFLDLLCEVVVKTKVTQEDEKRIQFSIATIGMHASSEELYKLSKKLKGIILKIKTEDSPNNSLWDEIMGIVQMFQASLYDGDTFEYNSQLTKALCNFDGLCTNEHQKMLEYIECMIYGFGFDTFVSNRCLFINIPIRLEAINEIKKTYEEEYTGIMPNNLYITLKIENEENGKCEGTITVYCGREKEEQIIIERIYNYKDNRFWLDPNTENRKKSHFKKFSYEQEGNGNPLVLGVNRIYHARVLYFKNRLNIELQSIMTDIFSYFQELWTENGTTVDVKTLKKDTEGKYSLVRDRFTFRRDK